MRQEQGPGARTSASALLAANPPLTPHPFRSREIPAPRASSGGGRAAPYHGELAEGMRVIVVGDTYCLLSSWSGLEMPQLPRGGVVESCFGTLEEAAGVQKISPELWFPLAPSFCSFAACDSGLAPGRAFSSGEFIASPWWDFLYIEEISLAGFSDYSTNKRSKNKCTATETVMLTAATLNAGTNKEGYQ